MLLLQLFLTLALAHAADHCPFCERVPLRLGDARLEGFRPPEGTANIFSSMILDESEHFVLKVTRGAFVPMYFLIISREHYANVSELPPDKLADLEKFKAHVESFYREVTRAPFVVFEHGSKACASAGACVDHLHLHLLPFAGEIENQPDLRLRTRFDEPKTIARLADLPRDEHYVFYQNPDGEMKYYVARDFVPSQLLRLLIAENIGAGEEFNWREFENDGDFFVNAARSVALYTQWRQNGAVTARQKMIGQGLNERVSGQGKLLCSWQLANGQLSFTK